MLIVIYMYYNLMVVVMFWLVLTRWGWVPHICVSKLTITGSDNGLSPDWRRAIIWTNAGILLIRSWGTNFSEILNKICTFFIQENAFENAVCKMVANLSQPPCVNVVNDIILLRYCSWYRDELYFKENIFNFFLNFIQWLHKSIIWKYPDTGKIWQAEAALCLNVIYIYIYTHI